MTIINGANGKKYASDYRAILNWVVDKVKNTNIAPNISKQQANSNFGDLDKFYDNLTGDNNVK